MKTLGHHLGVFIKTWGVSLGVSGFFMRLYENLGIWVFHTKKSGSNNSKKCFFFDYLQTLFTGLVRKSETFKAKITKGRKTKKTEI